MNARLFDLFEFHEGDDKRGEIVVVHLIGGQTITGELIDLDEDDGFVAIGSWRVLLSSVIAVGEPE